LGTVSPTIIHQYLFNAPSNSAVDNMGKTTNGTLVGGAYISGGSVYLTSSSAYVQLPAGLLINIWAAYSSFSIECWTTTDLISAYSSLFYFGQYQYTVGLGVNQNKVTGKPYVGFWNPSKNKAQGSVLSTPFGGQVDLHVVLTVASDGSFLLYLNGVSAFTKSSFKISPVPYDVYGYLGFTNFVGSIDEFNMWAGVLTPAQVLARYKTGPVPATQAPTFVPSAQPSFPSISPTVMPSSPTIEPTFAPSRRPTREPSSEPSVSMPPTVTPTLNPSCTPTVEPTFVPSVKPTYQPTSTPTLVPTMEPTAKPTIEPSSTPSITPTSEPTTMPTKSRFNV